MRNGGLGYAPRVLLHAANLRHGTDNFTSIPKEGVLRIFLSTASAGFEPANLGTKGQHATSAPPKPPEYTVCMFIFSHFGWLSYLFNEVTSCEEEVFRIWKLC